MSMEIKKQERVTLAKLKGQIKQELIPLIDKRVSELLKEKKQLIKCGNSNDYQ